MPVSILWGEEDPWEKVEWGRQLAKHAAVQVRGGRVGDGRWLVDWLGGRLAGGVVRRHCADIGRLAPVRTFCATQHWLGPRHYLCIFCAVQPLCNSCG